LRGCEVARLRGCEVARLRVAGCERQAERPSPAGAERSPIHTPEQFRAVEARLTLRSQRVRGARGPTCCASVGRFRLVPRHVLVVFCSPDAEGRDVETSMHPFPSPHPPPSLQPVRCVSGRILVVLGSGDTPDPQCQRLAHVIRCRVWSCAAHRVVEAARARGGGGHAVSPPQIRLK